MMNTKKNEEMLEYAAKAVGFVIDQMTWSGAWIYKFDAPTDMHGEHPIFLWNPLSDDGDALRLAVKLRIDINFYLDYIRVYSTDIGIITEYFNEDANAATRLVIVRAAAQIGKDMK